MHCPDEMSQSSITNLFAGLKTVSFSSLIEHALHFQNKLESYSLIFPAAQLCPSELINEICHHAKPLWLTTFPKTPQLPAPRCSPTSSHIYTHTSQYPHTLSYNYTIEQWDLHTGRHKH